MTRMSHSLDDTRLIDSGGWASSLGRPQLLS